MLTTLLLLPLGGFVSESKLSAVTEPGLALSVNDQFGRSATTAGDIDGDGILDLVSGAPHNDDGATDAGAVYVLFLEADGSVRESQTISATQGGFSGSLGEGDLFGWAVAGLGDVDSDSVPDIAVGARRDDDGGQDRGAVWILFLRSDGTVKGHQKISSSAGSFQGALMDGDQLGWSLVSPGDIDGDGTNDLAVGMQQSLPSSHVWPTELPGNIISAGLGNNWEPSGAVWNPVTERLFLVSDQGRVAEMDADGTNLSTVTIGGDLEGVTLRDPNTSLIYLGVENPDSIREFDVATGQLTGLSWNLTPWMQGPANAGVEALTWAKGQFYVGHEGEGDIYVFNTEDSGEVSLDRIIPSPMGHTSLTGLHYESSTETLYSLYRNKRVIETDLDGNILRQLVLHGVGDHQEGITLMTECPASEARIVLAQDTGKVFRYDGYPVNCLGPETLPGRGAFWTMLLDGDGKVRQQTLIGNESGGFDAEISYGDSFGASLAAPGDLDGDGIVDIAVGAPFDDDGGADRGAVWLVRMNNDGSVKEHSKISALSGGSAFLHDDDQFGWSLVSAGDLDGNGASDLYVGSPGADGDGLSRGAVDVLRLSSLGTIVGHERVEVEAELENYDQFGTSLVGGLDLNSDGANDIVVGAAYDDDGGQDCGALWQLFGAVEQAVSAIPYGCNSVVADTLKVIDGAATLGDQITLGLSNPFGTQPIGSMTAVVFGSDPAPGFPCGLSIPYWGMTSVGSSSEILLNSTGQLVVLPAPPLGAPGEYSTIQFGVPAATAFFGTSLFAQGFIWDPNANGTVDTALTSGVQFAIGE